MARWLWRNTVTPFLDCCDEDSVEMPDWDQETVRELTQHWARAELLQDQVFKLADWLEAAPEAHFTELLDFIESRRDAYGHGTEQRAQAAPVGPA